MRSTLLLAALALVAAASAQEKLNVLFVAVDDLNNDLRTYGHPLVESPNIDRLARRGMQFDRAYCNYPVCNPSRSSLLTGLYPDQTGVRSNGDDFRDRLPDVQTLPQMFRNAGYFVARVGKIFHYGVPAQIGTPGEDDPESWDETVNPRGRDKIEEDQIYSIDPVGHGLGGTLSWMAQDGTDEEQTDGLGATAAIRLLEEHAREPFFLAMGFYRPHTPYVAPHDYFRKYPIRMVRLPVEPLNDLVDLPYAAWVDRIYQYETPEIKKREAMQAYYASITFMDAQLGRILDALERLGLEENTVVVFWSDHGYHMGEHQLWQKTTLFENSARVPFIIASPGHAATAGLRTPALAELVDVYPTLAELCGLEPPMHLAGKSLVPVLEDPAARVRDSALTTFDSQDRVHRDKPRRPRSRGWSLRTERYRYTEWGPNGEHGAELYDHWNDPREFDNLALAPSEQETVARLKKQLEARKAEATAEPRR